MGKFRNLRIDWINHTVGFLSAVLGIYIAFRLENYREEQQEKEKVRIVKAALKKEIEDNLKIYKTNITELSGWLEYNDFYDRKWDVKNGGLVIGNHELTFMSKKQPHRFASLKEIKLINDTLKVFDLKFMVDVAPATGISTSSWKTAVASGILNSMDYSLTTKLSQLYDWTEKDIGTSEKELFENFLGVNKKEDSADLDKLVTHYRNILKVHTLKYDQLTRINSGINWNE
jgi:hypothetical protein